MKIVDLPTPLDRSLYEEAIEQYATLTASRARALYVVGNITYPGLSDLDLLVITDTGKRYDNEYFFSAFDRLPRRYHPLFLHQPFVVPDHLRGILRYTTHRRIHLVRGPDAVADTRFVESTEERWCKLLEGYCTYERFIDDVRSRDVVAAKNLIAVASSMRFTLRECDALCGTGLANSYAVTVDNVRSAFFDGDGTAAVTTVWNSFVEMFEEVSRGLDALLPSAAKGRIGAFARSVFRGEGGFEPVSAAYALSRSQAIDEYHDTLRAMHLSYGHLFFLAAHGDRSRPLRHNKMVRGAFRARRLFEEMWMRP